MLLSTPTSTQTLGVPSRPAGAPRGRRFAASANAAIRLLWTWRHRMKMRAELRGLMERADDRMLADINLNRAKIADEAGRPFWRE